MFLNLNKIQDLHAFKMDHQELDCDEMVRFKKEGKKVLKEYGNRMKAEGPTYISARGDSFDHGSVGESFSKLHSRSAREMNLDNGKKGGIAKRIAVEGDQQGDIDSV